MVVKEFCDRDKGNKTWKFALVKKTKRQRLSNAFVTNSG
jgi:hypothetical protein